MENPQNSIELEGLSKRFGERVAVEGLTFHIGRGEIFGLLGPNGAGKTTTVRMLTGLLRPTSGEARVFGTSIRGDGELLRKQVGLLTEQPGLYDRLTARDNLRFFIKLNELDEATVWPATEKYLQRFGLADRQSEPTGSFSKGMRQKLAIIRTLVHSPQVIFLDEPTSGLDPESARTVRDSIAELAAEGRTIVLCSHNLAEVERLCTRVAVIKRRLLTVAPVASLRRTGLTLEIKLAESAERAKPLLAALSFRPTSLIEGSLLKVLLDDAAQAPDVIGALVRGGLGVHSAVPAARPLEEVYLELMREGGLP